MITFKFFRAKFWGQWIISSVKISEIHLNNWKLGFCHSVWKNVKWSHKFLLFCYKIASFSPYRLPNQTKVFRKQFVCTVKKRLSGGKSSGSKLICCFARCWVGEEAYTWGLHCQNYIDLNWCDSSIDLQLLPQMFCRKTVAGLWKRECTFFFFTLSPFKTVVFLKATLIVASSSQIHELCQRIVFTDPHSYLRVTVRFLKFLSKGSRIEHEYSSFTYIRI